jgi:hypothetical protein
LKKIYYTIIINTKIKSACNTDCKEILLSGVNLEGGKLGYDTKKITSAKTWTSAGINVSA